MVTPVTEETTLVTVTIDGKEYEVPEGGNLVDMAKWYAGNDIPVFCYHPKMEPVGMCRMCVVEMGTEQRDRETGDVQLDEDGNPKIRWFPKLQTACTQTVSDGLHIRTKTDKVDAGRENVLEFLLTSHPLDCPICDKGGECPLQNLTMEHGPGRSRMYFDDKMKLNKHVPLGDLIYLDQERCIQCARCIRFQDELVGDDVLGFHERGRRLQIITNSDPGFDTYFSGNTTDICPVGALTTADFRFSARPWELTEVPSISPWDAAGENISLSTRLDRDFGGRAKIKRVMPRQNEYVNEIWISDKTRFGHHFTRSDDRLQQPMIRGGDTQRETVWDEAFNSLTTALGGTEDIAVIAGATASNEDLWEARQLVQGLSENARLGAWPPTHGGAEVLADVGLSHGSKLSNLGAGDAILVIASDLEEEVPVWRLQVKQAQDRGAYLVVANSRATRLEEIATESAEIKGRNVAGDAIRYEAGAAAHTLHNLSNDHSDIADKLKDATSLVIIAGAEGLTLDGSRALMQSAGNFLIESGHAGQLNSGLLATLPGANGMGLHYLGYTPETTQAIADNPPQVLITLNAEILDDDPTAESWLSEVGMIISLSLFPDKLAQKADFALPVQSFAERDGTFTNGERRVQRFYTAQGPLGSAVPAWKILAELRQRLGQGRASLSAAAVMLDMTRNLPHFEGMRYKELSRIVRQFPDVGGEDKYYGGTAYQNKGGIGIQIPTTAETETVSAYDVTLPNLPDTAEGEMLIVPSTRLYNRSNMFKPSELVHPRVAPPHVLINPADADTLDVMDGGHVEVRYGENSVTVRARLDESIPAGSVVLPRHLTDETTPLTPTGGTLSKATEPVAVEA